MNRCDYDFNRFEHEPIVTDFGSYCSDECAELDAADRAELNYEGMRERNQEFYADQAIDLEREKDIQ